MPDEEPRQIRIARQGTVAADVAHARKLLASFGERRCIRTGDPLFRVNDRSRHLYFVQRGTLEVRLLNDAGRCSIARFYAGASFAYDFGGRHVVTCEAAKASVAIDLPLSRLDLLAREGVELGLLMRRCRAFELQAFIAVCYLR